MNPYTYLLTLVRLLQLELYDTTRFVRGLPRLKQAKEYARGKVVWTAKLSVVTFLAFVFEFAVVAFAFVFGNVVVGVATFVVTFIFTPLFLMLAVWVVWPLNAIVKTLVLARARRTLQQFPNVKIVGITGSYGKTTMKEMITGMLREKYQVLATPESVNTPIGIARLITNELHPQTQVLVVEMGAYHKGDIAQLCALTPPDVAVLTGINESHLERFGSIENTIEAKFEIIVHAKKDAVAVVNTDDERVRSNVERFVGSHKVVTYSAQNAKTSLPNFVAPYAPATFAGASAVARELGLSDSEIARAAVMLRPAAHRLEPHAVAGDVLVIDDSYNGNPAGVQAAVQTLGTFQDRRKLYITPGLVEMGAEAPRLHREIGTSLASVADVVLLIENSVTPYIAEGLKAANFAGEVRWYKSAHAAHASLPSILKPKDVILFQNDWTEQYA